MRKEFNQQLFIKAYELAHKEASFRGNLDSKDAEYEDEIRKRVEYIYDAMLSIRHQFESDYNNPGNYEDGQDYDYLNSLDGEL